MQCTEKDNEEQKFSCLFQKVVTSSFCAMGGGGKSNPILFWG